MPGLRRGVAAPAAAGLADAHSRWPGDPLGGGALRRHGPRDGRRPQGAPASSRSVGRWAGCSPQRRAAGLRPVVLVPVPSRPGMARSRGHDPTYAIVREAARLLRGSGRAVTTARLLVSLGGVADQAGLDAAGRASNLAGSMSLPVERGPQAGRSAAPVRRLRRRPDHRCHRSRGPARAGVRGPPGRRDRRGRGHPATRARRVHQEGFFGATAFVVRPQRLASVHGVRPGPWLRRRDALDAQGIPTASRCQSQAKRST